MLEFFDIMLSMDRNNVRACLAAALLAALLSPACLNRKAPPHYYKLGEKVQAGSLIYNAIETKWLAQAGEGPEARPAKNRFLLVHLMVVNSGASDAFIPALTLEAVASGAASEEVIDGSGIPGWIGVVRKVKPVDKFEGQVVFDVTPGAYRLKIPEDVSSDRAQYIDLPFQLEAGPPPLPSALHPPPQ